MFTSLELDDELFEKAWRLSGIRTKRGLIEEALRVYIRLHEQAEVKSLRGKLQSEGEPAKKAPRGRRS
jgi:Arc/MetJ family transcription regulator